VYYVLCVRPIRTCLQCTKYFVHVMYIYTLTLGVQCTLCTYMHTLAFRYNVFCVCTCTHLPSVYNVLCVRRCTHLPSVYNALCVRTCTHLPSVYNISYLRVDPWALRLYHPEALLYSLRRSRRLYSGAEGWYNLNAHG
jgi:hypothetical protein